MIKKQSVWHSIGYVVWYMLLKNHPVNGNGSLIQQNSKNIYLASHNTNQQSILWYCAFTLLHAKTTSRKHIKHILQMCSLSNRLVLSGEGGGCHARKAQA